MNLVPSRKAKQARTAFEEEFFHGRYHIHSVYFSTPDRIKGKLDDGSDIHVDKDGLEGKVKDVIVAEVTKLPGNYSKLPLTVSGIPVAYICKPQIVMPEPQL